MAPAHTSRFVGRSQELESLDRAVSSARSGQAKTVILGGEAGVGKSRLIDEFLANHVGSDSQILRSTCIDYGTAPLPFGAILETLRPLTHRLSDADSTASQLLKVAQSQLNQILPSLDPALQPTAEGSSPVMASRPQFFESFLSLIEALANKGLLVLILEDFHWSDRSTRDLLAFLIASLNNSPVLLVISYRTDELVEGDELLKYFSQLQRNRSVARMHLQRFDKEHLALYLDEISGSIVDGQLLQKIWERSQGNPFYSEELFSYAQQSNSTELPATLGDMLIGHLRILSDTTQAMLRVAAAGGLSIDCEALEFVFDDPQFPKALREAMGNRILLENKTCGHVEFRHAILREIAYGDLLLPERRKVHLRYAQWLQNHDRPAAATGGMLAALSELSLHQYLGGDFPASLLTSIRAAEAGERTNGYAEVHAHLERALDLWGRVDDPQRITGIDLIELLRRAAEASHLEGDNNRAVELLQKAKHLSDDMQLSAELSLRLGCYLDATGESQEALNVHETAVKNLNEFAPKTQSEVLAAYAQSLLAAARHKESLEYAKKALQFARKAKSQALEINPLNVLGMNRVVLGEPNEGVADLQKALELAESLRLPTEIATGYTRLAGMLSGPLNRLEEALDVSRTGLQRVSELGLERHWGVALRSVLADTLFRIGRWDDAEQVVAEALRKTPKGTAALDLLLARAKLTTGRGDFQAARDDLFAVRSMTSRSIDLRYKVPLETLTAGVALWERQLDVAAEAVSSGLSHVHSTDDVWLAGPLIWHGMRVAAEKAENFRALGRNDEVALCIADAQRLRQMSLESSRLGQSKGALKLVTDAYDELCEAELLRTKGEFAVDAWQKVAENWDALGQPYPAAYARWHWAEAVLANPGGSRKAAPILHEAYRQAEQLGAQPLLDCITEVAQRAAIDLSVDVTVVDIAEPAVSVLDQLATEVGLTKRESQILELISHGQSNREIADACFISESTASVHVSRIMSKLGVQSRTQAAAVLHRRLSMGK